MRAEFACSTKIKFNYACRLSVLIKRDMAGTEVGNGSSSSKSGLAAPSAGTNYTNSIKAQVDARTDNLPLRPPPSLGPVPVHVHVRIRVRVLTGVRTCQAESLDNELSGFGWDKHISN